MRSFLVEIPVPEPDQEDLQRATHTLRVAQSRLSRTATLPRPLIAGVTAANGRLVCLIEAESVPAVRRLVALALLPRGRIREVSSLGSVRLARSP